MREGGLRAGEKVEHVQGGQGWRKERGEAGMVRSSFLVGRYLPCLVVCHFVDFVTM